MLNNQNYFYEKRISYFEQLLKFNFDFKVCGLSANYGPVFVKTWKHWTPVSQIGIENLAKETLSIHREILPNEWVYDIDGTSYKYRYILACKLEQRLNELKIPFNPWSSGNGLHYHIFLDEGPLLNYDFDLYKPIVKHYFLVLEKNPITSVEDFVNFQRMMHKAIGLFLIKDIRENKDKCWFDKQKFAASRTLIRLEGSLHPETFAYKTYLNYLPKKQVLVKSFSHVEFPLKIIVWKPDPEFYFKLFTLAYKYIVIPRCKEKPFLKGKNMRKKSGKSNKNPKVNWIETILRNTFTDGRKRLIDLVLSPYLVNFKNLNEDRAVEIIHKWALRCQEKEPIKINKRIADPTSLQAYIKYKVTRAKDINLNFLSKKNAQFVFSDCEEILDVINKKNHQ